MSSINNKASHRLYYLRQLKRAGLSARELIQVYLSMTRPVAEYACQVWSTSLTEENKQQLESIQKRAFKIIAPNLSYSEALQRHQIQTLEARRDVLCRTLFRDIMAHPENKLYNLLPPERVNTYEIRNFKKYSLPRTKTERFKSSFINWGLFNCQ